MSLSQEHIATLRQEIPMVTRQIQLISGPEFTVAVPEVAANAALEQYKQAAEACVAAAKASLERYKRGAEEHVAEWDSAHRPPVQSRLLNLGAFYNPGAAQAQATAPAPATEPAQAAGVNPELVASIARNPALAALLQALQVRPVQG